MNEHRYVLEPYKGMNTRYRCPNCQQRDKTFSRYIDRETNEHIHPSVGRCNRENNCGYHLTPKQYFQDNNISFDANQSRAAKPLSVAPQPKHVSFIPIGIFKASLKGHAANHFVNYLVDLFGVEVASGLVSRYFIATSKLWEGATVFWQVDTQGKIRTGKIMLYNPTTGKRVKEPFNHIQWAHKALKQPEFALKQCLFGEHLLIDRTKPVAIVESEKTAIIASAYLPQFIWLAVGSLTNLNAEKCNILKGRNIILFPDLKGFEKWSNKAKELTHLAKFFVSDLLERKASETEKEQGFDLADYLIKFNYKAFLLSEPETTKPAPNIQPTLKAKPKEQLDAGCNCGKPEQTEPRSWDKDILELETYFSGITLPTSPIKLNAYTTIMDVSHFINSHLDIVKAKSGIKTFLPHLNRLKELQQLLTTNLN